jgi:hypothetical protein
MSPWEIITRRKSEGNGPPFGGSCRSPVQQQLKASAGPNVGIRGPWIEGRSFFVSPLLNCCFRVAEWSGRPLHLLAALLFQFLKRTNPSMRSPFFTNEAQGQKPHRALGALPYLEELVGRVRVLNSCGVIG